MRGIRRHWVCALLLAFVVWGCSDQADDSAGSDSVAPIGEDDLADLYDDDTEDSTSEEDTCVGLSLPDHQLCNFRFYPMPPLLEPGLYDFAGITTGDAMTIHGSSLKASSGLAQEEFLYGSTEEEIRTKFKNTLANRGIDPADTNIALMWSSDGVNNLRHAGKWYTDSKNPNLLNEITDAYKLRLRIAKEEFAGEIMLWGFQPENKGRNSDAHLNRVAGYRAMIARGLLDNVDAVGMQTFHANCSLDGVNYRDWIAAKAKLGLEMAYELLDEADLLGEVWIRPYLSVKYFSGSECKGSVAAEDMQIAVDAIQENVTQYTDEISIWAGSAWSWLPQKLAEWEMVPLHCFCSAVED